MKPHLEHASSVWFPHQKYQVDKLEKVQRKEARFAKNCWIREGVMTNMLSDLKWDSPNPERESRARHVLQGHTPAPCKNNRNFHPKKYGPLACNTNYYMGTFFPPLSIYGILSLPPHWTSQTLLNSKMS